MANKPTTPNKQLSKDELNYTELKKLNRNLEKYMRHRNVFYRGLLGGFAGFIGATILVAIIIYIMSRLTHIPIIGDIKVLIDLIEYFQEHSKCYPTNNTLPLPIN